MCRQPLAPQGTNAYYYHWNGFSFGIGFFHEFDRTLGREFRRNHKVWRETSWSWND